MYSLLHSHSYTTASIQLVVLVLLTIVLYYCSSKDTTTHSDVLFVECVRAVYVLSDQVHEPNLGWVGVLELRVWG